MLLVFLQYLVSLSCLFNINNDEKTRFINISSSYRSPLKQNPPVSPAWGGWQTSRLCLKGTGLEQQATGGRRFQLLPMPKRGVWAKFWCWGRQCICLQAEVPPHHIFSFPVCPKGLELLIFHLSPFSVPCTDMGRPIDRIFLERDVLRVYPVG